MLRTHILLVAVFVVLCPVSYSDGMCGCASPATAPARPAEQSTTTTRFSYQSYQADPGAASSQTGAAVTATNIVTRRTGVAQFRADRKIRDLKDW